MANKIFSTTDGFQTLAGSVHRTFGKQIEVEPGYMLSFNCNSTTAFSTMDYSINVATGALGAETRVLLVGVAPENVGIIGTNSVQFDSDHVLTFFQDATSGNINACMSEWDLVGHAQVANVITDLGITGGGLCVNLETIDATHYLITYDTGTDLVAQVIEVNAGTYVVSTVGTPLVTGTTQQACHSHVVQIDATHYSISFTKTTPGTSGHFMIVEVNLGTWAVTTATAATDLGGGDVANVYPGIFYIDKLTWTFKVSATQVVVFYQILVSGEKVVIYKVIDINLATWVITVGAQQLFWGVQANLLGTSFLTQPNLANAEAYFITTCTYFRRQTMWKIGWDAANTKLIAISNGYNLWTGSAYIRFSPGGYVTEISGGDFLVTAFKVSSAGYEQVYSIANDDAPTTGGGLKPVSSGTLPGNITESQYGDVVAFDSTHFVVLGGSATAPFVTYGLDAAGQIEVLDDSFATGYYDTVSGLKLDSTHMLLTTGQDKFRVAEVDGSYVGSWSAVETSLSAPGTDINTVRMYISGEDVNFWYVICVRKGSSLFASAISVDKATYVVAQVGSDLVINASSTGYDMTPVEGYTDKWVVTYSPANLFARVIGVDGAFEPVLVGAEFDFGFTASYSNLQSVDATHFCVTYSDAASFDGFAETLEVNVGTWALTAASAAAYEFDPVYVVGLKSRLVKVDSTHVALIWGSSSSSTTYVNYRYLCLMRVFEMDPATFNWSTSQEIKLISNQGVYGSLGLLDTDTIISVSGQANVTTNATANVQLWDAVVAGATQVAITGAGVDFCSWKFYYIRSRGSRRSRCS